MSEPQILESFGLSEQKNFAFKNSAKAFKILSDSLYMDKVQAVIRELSTNAYDAHIDAGTVDKPFEIHIPCAMNPHFSIRDFGTGMDHETIINRYTTYFDSSKTERQDVNGTLGLGSKSPFAIADEFAITSFVDGTARSYFAYKDDQGFPSISLVNESATEEPNGLEIKIGVRGDIISDFDKKAPLALYHFDPHPVIINSSVSIKKEEKILEGKNDDWYFTNISTSTYGAEPYAFMANVSYPINLDILKTFIEQDEKHLLSLFNNKITPLRILFKGREIEHTPSREGLQYTKQTVKALKIRLQEIYTELTELVLDNFEDCENFTDILGKINFIKNKDKSSFDLQKNHPLWKKQFCTFDNVQMTVLSSIFSSETFNLKNGKVQNFAFSKYVNDFNNISERCFSIGGKISDFTSELNKHFNTAYLEKAVLDVLSNIDVKYLNTIHSNRNYLNRIMFPSFVLDDDIENVIDIQYSFDQFAKNNNLEKSDRKTLALFKEHQLKEFAHYLNRNSFANEFNKIKVDIRLATLRNALGTFSPAETDFTRTVFGFTLPFIGCKTVLLIDDYPKSKIQFKNKFFCAYASNKGFNGYISISNKSSFKKFLEDKKELYLDICKFIAFKNNIPFELSSQINVIDEKYFIKERAPKLAVEKTDLTSLKKLVIKRSTNELMFLEATDLQDSPLINDVQRYFPPLDDKKVIFIPKKMSKHILFGYDNNPNAVALNQYGLNLNDNPYFYDDLIKILSIVLEKDLFKEYTFVEVSTASKTKKIKETSNWMMIDTFISKVLSNSKNLEKIISIFGIMSSNRFFRSQDGVPMMYETVKSNQAIVKNVIANMTPAVATAHALCFMLKNKGNKVIEAAKVKLGIIEEVKSKHFENNKELFALIEPIVNCLKTNELLKEQTPEIFQKFSADGRGEYTYDESNFLINGAEIFKLFNMVVDTNKAKEVLHKWIADCANIVEKNPAINFFDPRYFEISRSSIQKAQNTFELIVTLKKEI